MDEMTLEQVREWLAGKERMYVGYQTWATSLNEQEVRTFRAAIDAHLATPAQTVDVEAVRELVMDARRYRWLRERVDWKPQPEDASGKVYLVATMVSAVYGDTNDQTDEAIDKAMHNSAQTVDIERICDLYDAWMAGIGSDQRANVEAMRNALGIAQAIGDKT